MHRAMVSLPNPRCSYCLSSSAGASRLTGTTHYGRPRATSPNRSADPVHIVCMEGDRGSAPFVRRSRSATVDALDVLGRTLSFNDSSTSLHSLADGTRSSGGASRSPSLLSSSSFGGASPLPALVSAGSRNPSFLRLEPASPLRASSSLYTGGTADSTPSLLSLDRPAERTVLGVRLSDRPLLSDESKAPEATAQSASDAHGSDVAPLMTPAVVAALSLAQMAHFYSMCSIFAYAGFLAADSGWVDSEDSAGYVAGLLATMLPLGRLPTSVLWGQYADRAGRRPALIGSMLGIAFGNLVFGFTTSLWGALAVRFVLLGGCNGWNSVLGPLCAEVGGPRSSRLLGFVFGAGGVINLLGPAIGGATYGLLAGYPALLPSLIGAALGAAAALAAWALVPETLPPLPPKADGGIGAGERWQRFDSSDESAGDGGDRSEGALLRAALRSPPLPAIVWLRTGIGLAAFASYDVVPLWAIASARAGGLALEGGQLGALLSCAAGVQLLWTTLLMGRVFERVGVWGSFIGACTVGAAAIVSLPIAHAAGAPLAAISVLIAAQSAALNTGCTASVAHTNNACCAYPALSGAINGVVVTVESVAKAAGPSIGAPLFAFAINARPAAAEPPSGALLAFGGLAAFVLLHAAGAALALPRGIDEPLAPAFARLS